MTNSAFDKSGSVTTARLILVGLLVGFLLNLSGWLGNNFVLGRMWREAKQTITPVAWHSSLWKDVFSFAPDFLYGFAMVWLCVKLRPWSQSFVTPSLQAGIFVSLVGGITAYFAIGNSGFIPWPLAIASFGLVLATKLPLALLAGWMLEKPESR